MKLKFVSSYLIQNLQDLKGSLYVTDPQRSGYTHSY